MFGVPRLVQLPEAVESLLEPLLVLVLVFEILRLRRRRLLLQHNSGPHVCRDSTAPTSIVPALSSAFSHSHNSAEVDVAELFFKIRFSLFLLSARASPAPSPAKRALLQPKARVPWILFADDIKLWSPVNPKG